ASQVTGLPCCAFSHPCCVHSVKTIRFNSFIVPSASTMRTNMPNDSVFHICRSRSRAAELLGHEYEAWQKDHVEALAAREVEDWLAECVKLGEATLDLFRHTRGLLRSNRLAEPQGAGERLLELFEETLRVFLNVQSGLKEA